MIWLIIIVVILILSFFLALRSMKGYQDVPPSKFPYGLFLIRNEELVHQNGVLNKLYSFGLEANAIISLEKLFKGGEHALVLFAPQNVVQFLPELELLEIEDYVDKKVKNGQKKASVDEVICWSLRPKSEVEISIPPDFLNNFSLEENEQLFWQLVLMSHKKENHFQVNIRVMIVESEMHKRIDIAKKLDQYLQQTANLHKKETNESIMAIFSSYQRRALIPSEVEGFVLSSQKIKELL